MRVRLEQATYQSVRENRELVIPTSCVMMCHYACRLLGNEPPTLKMKWAWRRPVSQVWNEVVLSHECHFIPTAASFERRAQCVAISRGGLEGKRCVNALLTRGGTQTWPLIGLNESRFHYAKTETTTPKKSFLNVQCSHTTVSHLKHFRKKKRCDFGFQLLAMQSINA